MMIKKTTLLTITSASILPLSFFTQQGFAQQHDATMVVSANRFVQPVSSVLAPVTIVTRDDIQRWQSTSLVDVMRRLPGVDVASAGTAGQQSSLFIRGTNSSHVLLLIDGIRLNQAGISGSSDLSQIPLSLIQRIEYIRGARSAVYGSDAIGGVVNIITGRDENGSVLNGGIGSEGRQNEEFSTQQQMNKTRLTLVGSHTRTRGIDVVAGLPDAFGHFAQPDRDGFRSSVLYGALEQQFNDAVKGFIRGYGFDNRTSYDSAGQGNSPGAFIDTRKLYSQTWDSGLQFGNEDYSSQFIASYSHSKDNNYSPQDGPYASSARLDDVRQYNLQWGNSVRLFRGMASAGIDWQKQTSQPGTNYVDRQQQQRNTGIYATLQQQLASVTLEGAVRGDNNQQFGWYHTWQSSMAWEFLPGFRLLASYGTAFKAPNLGQLYSNYYGNRHLRPEKSRQWEAGLEGQNGALNWRASAYRNEISDMIDSDPFSFRYYNIGKARISGIETTASFQHGPFTHTLSYDYLNARNAITHRLLPRRAKQQIRYQLDWARDNIDLSLSWHYLGRRVDTDYSKTASRTVNMGGFSRWDIAVSYSLTSQVTVRGRIANLLDKNDEMVYGYQTPGREYSLGASYRF